MRDDNKRFLLLFSLLSKNFCKSRLFFPLVKNVYEELKNKENLLEIHFSIKTRHVFLMYVMPLETTSHLTKNGKFGISEIGLVSPMVENVY